MIFADDEYSAKFLIENKANVNARTGTQQETALHMVASLNPEVMGSKVMEGMARVTEMLLKNGADANVQDKSGK